MKREGKVTETAARAIVTEPSSSVPHYFQHIALKLRQFIKEEHAIVPQGHLARPWHGSAADEPSIADGVVGRAEGPRAHEATGIFQNSGDAVDARGFDGLIERHGRQNCRDALGEHGLARSGRSDKQNVMTARASDLQSALRGLLAMDVSQVDGVLRRFGEQLVRIDAHRLKRFRRIHQIDRLGERLQAEDVHALHNRGFARVCLGNGH